MGKVTGQTIDWWLQNAVQRKFAWAAQAIKNADRPENRVKRAAFFVERYASLADALWLAFSFKESPEGYAFWSCIYHALKNKELAAAAPKTQIQNAKENHP